MPLIVRAAKGESRRILVGDAVVTCAWRKRRFVISIEAPDAMTIEVQSSGEIEMLADIEQDVVKKD